MDARPSTSDASHTPDAQPDRREATQGATQNSGYGGERKDTGAPTTARSALRGLPSTDRVTRHLRERFATHGTAAPTDLLLTWAARTALVEARTAIASGGSAPDIETITARAEALMGARTRPRLRPVINATGVIINTNLGRSPLSAEALVAVEDIARGYSNLEYDLVAGERGSRQTPVREILREVLGVDDALVVNNNAAAVLVVLTALAAGREVILSRGEMVEIGGGFRVPDVMRQSGARLVEVGTTNRTRVDDYRAAITPETALLLAVHPSNFRLIGFTETPPLAELAELAHEHGLPLMHDLGSGALVATEIWGIEHELTPAESLAAGCDVVCFSGDKLLGGPQAGIIVGRASVLARIAHHPLMRAIRIDKMTLAALEATLRSYRDGTHTQTIPTLRMLATPLSDLRARAEAWAAALRAEGIAATATEGESAVGGGTLPGEKLPTVLCAIGPFGAETRGSAQDKVADIAMVAARLRTGDPAVLARVLRDRILLDPRTVAPEEDAPLLAALRTALGVSS